MNEKKDPTLADIAKRLGVSSATCSMALHNHPRIPEATKKRVRECARLIGYEPDPLLSALAARRHLATKSPANLASVMDDRWLGNSDMKWMELLNAGMQRACAQLGYHLETLFISKDLNGGKDAARIFRARGIHGVLLLPTMGACLNPNMDWEQFATIAIGNTSTARPLHRIGMDKFSAMSMVCQKLKELGYRRVGLVNQMQLERGCCYAWLGALTKEHFLEKGLDVVPPYLPELLTREGVLEWILREKPQCVVTSAAEVLSWIESGSYKIPEDLGCVFLAKESLSKSNVAGILQDIDVVGEYAVKQLHAMLLCGEKSFPDTPREILICPKWVDGNTLRNMNTKP